MICGRGDFSGGAVFRVGGMPVIIASLVASRAALLLIGAGATLFTGRGVLPSGVRQPLMVGFAAAGVTYGVGKLIAVAVTS
jgi:VIT1/CCC1 family predicted Fe2+/Mn2+ transporter